MPSWMAVDASGDDGARRVSPALLFPAPRNEPDALTADLSDVNPGSCAFDTRGSLHSGGVPAAVPDASSPRPAVAVISPKHRRLHLPTGNRARFGDEASRSWTHHRQGQWSGRDACRPCPTENRAWFGDAASQQHDAGPMRLLERIPSPLIEACGHPAFVSPTSPHRILPATFMQWLLLKLTRNHQVSRSSDRQKSAC